MDLLGWRFRARPDCRVEIARGVGAQDRLIC